MRDEEFHDKRILDSIYQFAKDKNIVLKHPTAVGFSNKENIPVYMKDKNDFKIDLSQTILHKPEDLTGKVLKITFPKQREVSEKNIVEYDFTFDYSGFVDIEKVIPEQTIRSMLEKWSRSLAIDEKKRQLIIKREWVDNQLRIFWRTLHRLYHQSHHYSEEHHSFVPRVKDLIAENKRLKKLINRKNSRQRTTGFSIIEKNFFQNEALILAWRRACYQKFLYRKYTRELERLNRRT